MKKLVGYLLQGLLIVAPITITGFVLYKLVDVADKLLEQFMTIEVPGTGVVVIIAFLTLLGYIGSTVIAKPIFAYFGKLIEKAPLVKVLYSSVKDLLSAFVGKEKKFNEPVLVKMNNDSNVYKMGFITSKDLSNIGINDDKVAVYLPHSYNFSGNLFIVPSENVTPLQASASDVMKFIVSGGVTKIE